MAAKPGLRPVQGNSPLTGKKKKAIA